MSMWPKTIPRMSRSMSTFAQMSTRDPLGTKTDADENPAIAASAATNLVAKRILTTDKGRWRGKGTRGETTEIKGLKNVASTLFSIFYIMPFEFAPRQGPCTAINRGIRFSYSFASRFTPCQKPGAVPGRTMSGTGNSSVVAVSLSLFVNSHSTSPFGAKMPT